MPVAAAAVAIASLYKNSFKYSCCGICAPVPTFVYEMRRKTMDELGRVPAGDIAKVQRHPIIIILDDVRSMQNVGSVFRTCDAFSANAIYLCGYTPCPPHRDIHKSALGATDTVPWQHFDKVTDAIANARGLGYSIAAAEQVHGSKALNQLGSHDEKLAIIFGNEVTGVSDEALQLANYCIEIPQWGAKHSLNISVSVGVVLWELVRNER